MTKLTFAVFILIVLSVLSLSGEGERSQCQDRSEPGRFPVVETTVASIHQALRSGALTCRELVEIYLKRIEAYDQPTKLNALVVINPDALKRADELDREFQETKKLRPLHGIPVIVKDNYDTMDLPTTAGSLALKGSIPPDDAFQVRRLREAGAVILAKSNMAEWAFSPYVTESSLAGVTRNPYDLERVPAGSPSPRLASGRSRTTTLSSWTKTASRANASASSGNSPRRRRRIHR